MPHTLQEFLTAATEKAATELVAAYLRLPEDKRAWSPAPSARTALDLVVECALLNGYTADLILARRWPDGGFEEYGRARAEAAALDWDDLHARLRENTRRVIAAIRAVPDDALGVPIELPMGTQTLAETLAYPYWNMTYHQGQINYIASILGCLD